MIGNFDITGMSCAACSAHVEKCVGETAGVKNVSVNLLQNSMRVEYDEGVVSADGIIKAVESGGYGASVKGAEKTAAKITKTPCLADRAFFSYNAFSSALSRLQVRAPEERESRSRVV